MKKFGSILLAAFVLVSCQPNPNDMMEHNSGSRTLTKIATVDEFGTKTEQEFNFDNANRVVSMRFTDFAFDPAGFVFQTEEFYYDGGCRQPSRKRKVLNDFGGDISESTTHYAYFYDGRKKLDSTTDASFTSQVRKYKYQGNRIMTEFNVFGPEGNSLLEVPIFDTLFLDFRGNVRRYNSSDGTREEYTLDNKKNPLRDLNIANALIFNNNSAANTGLRPTPSINANNIIRVTTGFPFAPFAPSYSASYVYGSGSLPTSSDDFNDLSGIRLQTFFTYRNW
jgi:hypothetical protein